MSEPVVLKDRYRQVTDRVAEAAKVSGRRPDDIIVVAVTKTATPEQIRELIEMGHQDFGESRVQQMTQRAAMTEEFLARHHAMTSSRKTEVPGKIRWHMIGHLQRNKVKMVLPLVVLIHGVDSLRLAEEIQTQAAKQDRVAEVLIQVNTSGERSKSGVALPAVGHLAEQMLSMYNLRVRGMMTMAPMADNPEEVRPVFERTAEVFKDLCKMGTCGERFNILSMGMSNDYHLAVECGANVVRVGRAIFGEVEEPASVKQAE